MSRIKPLFACALAASTAFVGFAPSDAAAQSKAELDRRQKMKNEWRNIAYAAGALGIYGLLKKDNTLTFAGAAGALYSLHRYEQDRKSQNRLQRLRASYFSRPYFVRNGVRFNRVTTTRNGQRYYYFVRAR